MNRRIINIILTSILVFALVTGSLSIENFLPAYKDEIKAHENSDVGRFRYINATDELNIYPWNEYDEDTCTGIQNPGLEGTTYTVSGLLVKHIEELFPEFIPNDIYEFSSKLYVKQSTDLMYYIQDYTYMDIYGRRCNVNAVFNYDILEYLRCSYEDEEYIAKEEINIANENLMNSIKHITEWYYMDHSTYFYSNDLYVGDYQTNDELCIEELCIITPLDANPINRFFATYLTFLASPPTYDEEAQYDDVWIHLIDSSAIYYDSYFILSFNVSLASATASTLYIFFDPVLNCVVGYSLNP